MSSDSYPHATRILILNTVAFILSFAAWMINGVLVTFLVSNGLFNWSPLEIGFLLGIPVLFGSVTRLPIGILTDKLGGKNVMTAILILSAVPLFFLSMANSYIVFFLLSFGFGLAGSSFAAGVAYTSLWFPKEKQGTALGIFGSGTLGASLTTLFSPTALKYLTNDGTNLEGWRTLPQLYAGMLILMAVIYWIGTKNKLPTQSKTFVERLAPLKEIRVWRFGLYYFFTFGSFVALAQWLIPYYVNVYSLSIVMAGFMATAFSFPAGIIRSLGGWLSDKSSARTVLLWVFGTAIIGLIFLFPPRMELLAPGEGVISKNSGVVKEITANEIVVGDSRYVIQQQEQERHDTKIYFGIHRDKEDFLLLPNANFWHEPQVKVGDSVLVGQLIAKGSTHIYFQANIWIFTGIVFIIGLLMGIGSAAVYKHIADYYPTNIGAVGGIVGVLGGLGGFAGPIIFGYLLKTTGVWTTCWIFLSVVALVCIILQRFAIKAIIQQDSKKKQKTTGALV